MAKKYKIEVVEEKINVKNFFLGSIQLPIVEIETTINSKSTEGWNFESISVETDRSFIFWSRERAILVFSKNE